MRPNHSLIGKAMIYASWALGIGLLTVYFNAWLDQQRNPNQSVQTMIRDGAPEVVLQRNRYGHYYAIGEINGRPVEFLLDTGATDVAVPAGIAERLQLDRGRSISVRTANGTATAYLSRLDSVSLGGITLSNVRANITPGIGGDEVLLGMSFLRHLEFTQRGDQLILKPLLHQQ
ncbi:MAG: retropepsin-like aspartic protease family protein [Gammaproteobacteria bacterium]